MITFLKLIFLSKTILITPFPVDIEGNVELQFEEPVSAITGGAAIEIGLSKNAYYSDLHAKDIFLPQEKLAENFPLGSISATLYTKDGRQVLLADISSATSADEAFLTLNSFQGVPTEIDFVKVVIASTVLLENVSVYWRNYKH